MACVGVHPVRMGVAQAFLLEVSMEYFWLRFRRQILIGVAMVVLLGGAGGWFVVGRAHTPVAISPGAAQSAPSSDTSMVPVAAVDARPSAWDSATISARQSDVAAAVQCERAEHGVTAPLTLDPTLNVEAEAVVARMQADLTLDQQTALADYEWATMVIIEQPISGGCGWQGWTTAITGSTTLTAVGIAIIPPVGYSPPAALILGRTR